MGVFPAFGNAAYSPPSREQWMLTHPAGLNLHKVYLPLAVPASEKPRIRVKAWSASAPTLTSNQKLDVACFQHQIDRLCNQVNSYDMAQALSRSGARGPAPDLSRASDALKAARQSELAAYSGAS